MSRPQKQQPKLDEKGFTLAGTLVSLIMVTVVGAVLAQFASNASHIFTGVERNGIVADTFEVLRPMLAKRETCSLNFGNWPEQNPVVTHHIVLDKNPASSGTLIQNNLPGGRSGISQASSTLTALEASPFLEVGVPFRGITLTELRIVNRTQVNTTTFLAELVAKFEYPQGNTTQTLIRSLPLMVVSQNGYIKQCWARKAAEKPPLASVCGSMSGSYDGFDEQNGSCGYASGRWINGTATIAACPGGILPPNASSNENCAVQYPPGFKDNGTKVTVSFSDGSSEQIGRAPVIRVLDVQNRTCHCFWAADLGSSYAGATCQIYCAVP